MNYVKIKRERGILVVGDGHSPIHEKSLYDALRELEYSVKIFFWADYFKSKNYLTKLLLRIQNKFIIGPNVNRLNREFYLYALKIQPFLIFIYRGTHIKPSTLIELKKHLPNTIFVGYNNDDPFSKKHPFWLWRNFLKSIKYYDFVFAYRPHNIVDFNNFGCKNVDLLMPWFIPRLHYPSVKNDKNIFDVIFVGHYENDDRIKFLEAIDNEKNLKLGIYGPDWDKAPHNQWLCKYHPIKPLFGRSYRKALLSSKIALCFLSKLNRDAYTRRCFEIPAMGKFLMCQYSRELSEIFVEGKEIVFFKTRSEMIRKIHFYLANDELRLEIAFNGLQKVNSSGHDVISRAKYMMHKIKALDNLP